MHAVNFFKSPYTLFTGVLLLLMTTIGCDKENTPEKKQYYFTGITPTDANGNLMALPDTTDWNTTDVWTPEEMDLFTAQYTTGCAPSFDYKIYMYPNPCISTFRLTVEKDSTTRIALRLIDENFKVLHSIDSIPANALAFDASALGIKDTIRMYYKFIKNGCEYRGHGDILIK
jgi:hypothetical protein